MLYPNVSFPVTAGTIATHLRTGLASWTSLTVAPKRPATMPRRFLSIRDDGGTQAGLHMVNRYGVNVWAGATTAADAGNNIAWVDAENLAREAMGLCRSLPGVGAFKSTGTYFGPIEVEDDPAFTFSGYPMAHYYFSFAAVVKGTQL